MWHGGCRLNIAVAASFVWRCLSGSAVAPFPHPAHLGFFSSRAVQFALLAARDRIPATYSNRDTVGEAAHISAAAPGGKRYDSSLTPEERRAPSNGIWLCELCAKRGTSHAPRAVRTLRDHRMYGGRQLQHRRALALDQAREQHHLSVGEFQRIVMEIDKCA
jgi:hypothetical protein